MDWARMLAYVTGTVDQELLARNEYLAAENRILKSRFAAQLRGSFSPPGCPPGGPLPGESIRSARFLSFSATVRIAEIDSRRTWGITASFT